MFEKVVDENLLVKERRESDRNKLHKISKICEIKNLSLTS